MTTLKIEQFSGMAPQLSDKQLKDNMATYALNSTFFRGRLDPLKETIEIANVGTAGDDSVFYYNGEWVTGKDQSYVGTILPQDIRKRIYFTDSNYPKIRSGAEVYRLGIPRPEPTVAVIEEQGDITTSAFSVNQQSYVCTYVDGWGAEGPHSVPSDSLEIGTGGSAKVTLPTAPTGNYNMGSNSLIRIYRSNVGSQTTAFQFVAEVPISAGQYIDSTPSDQLQEVVPSAEWIGPPDDDTELYPDGPLKGLIAMPNGSLVGFSGNQICVSLPYLPHAWPMRYRFSTEFPIVGIAAVQNGIFIGTEGNPYMLAGIDPSAMAIIKTESSQACKSTRSVVDMGDFAIYAGDDGLISAQGAATVITTKGLIDRDTWQKTFQPSTIRAFQYEGRYIAFYGPVEDGTGFIFDPLGATAALTLINGRVLTGWEDRPNDRVIVIYDDNGSHKIGAFNEGGPLEFDWISKDFQFVPPIGLDTVRIEAEAYPVTLTITADGVELPPLTIPSSDPHMLPFDFVAKSYFIGLSGTNAVESVLLTDSVSEAI